MCFEAKLIQKLIFFSPIIINLAIQDMQHGIIPLLQATGRNGLRPLLPEDGGKILW